MYYYITVIKKQQDLNNQKISKLKVFKFKEVLTMFGLVPFRRNNGGLTKRGDYFDQLFDSFFDDDLMTMPSNFFGNAFRVDMKENENEYIIEADLPGIQKDAINIDYENNYLTVSAKRNDTVEDKNQNYVRRERRSGEFKRTFFVDNVQEDKIDAAFKDGVLKVTLPKSQKGLKNTRRIDIH